MEQAHNGRDALRRIYDDGKIFDLLVTDHEMPALTGLQLVERLRKKGFAGKIMVHSSELNAKDAAAYQALGIDHILRKPVHFDEFMAVLQRLLGF